MVRLEASERIRGSPEKLWALLTEPTNYQNFFRLGVIEDATGKLDHLGAGLRMTLTLGIPMRLKVSDALATQRLVLRSHYGMRFQMEWQLQVRGNLTETTLRTEYLTPYSVKGMIVEEEATRHRVGELMRETTASLKSLVESS